MNYLWLPRNYFVYRVLIDTILGIHHFHQDYILLQNSLHLTFIPYRQFHMFSQGDQRELFFLFYLNGEHRECPVDIS